MNIREYSTRRDLHSFPTRRSSDLDECREGRETEAGERRPQRPARDRLRVDEVRGQQRDRRARERDDQRGDRGELRSEEHTSELQSRRDLVCRLLLEKKK